MEAVRAGGVSAGLGYEGTKGAKWVEGATWKVLIGCDSECAVHQDEECGSNSSIVARRWMRSDRTERVMEEMELLTHGIASRSCLTVKLGTMNLGKAVSELIRCKGSTPRRAAAPPHRTHFCPSAISFSSASRRSWSLTC